MVKKLVVVESPTKVKTISKYLGSDYVVMSSVGHVRDLIDPKDIPAEKKTGSIGKFSVDVDADFVPFYSIINGKKKVIDALKKELKDSSELILATDEDREGEAIAWHLLEVLKPKVPVRRMVFHEITPSAINSALQNTRTLDANLVDAQEARRIFDRLYGYEISPVLWRKVGAGTSAGRVQSVATRLIVDREKARINFISSSYFSIAAQLVGSSASRDMAFDFELLSCVFADGITRKVAQGRDFDSTGELRDKTAFVLTKDLADGIVCTIENSVAKIVSIESKPYTRKPHAPFTTSTLQQEASSKLGFSAKKTMTVAQALYENGYITYMRTDSVLLSQEAVRAAKQCVGELFGKDEVQKTDRVWSSKTKNAQEAHEAIRPSGAQFRNPAELAASLNQAELKLYDLIYKRTLACFMKDATGTTSTVEAEVSCPLEVGGSDALRAVVLRTSGTEITNLGFLRLYQDDADVAHSPLQLQSLKEGEAMRVSHASHSCHATNPPARYTEASIIKKLDELGIGRPSTYAQTISTIEDRGYIVRRGSALVPSWRAFCVIKLLERHCMELIEYNFTAKMEEDLDKIAEGSREKVQWLHDLYFGTQEHPGLRAVFDSIGDIDARDINSFAITPSILLRVGRFGTYLQEGESDSEGVRRANVPDALAPDEITPQVARELLDSAVDSDRPLGKSANGYDIVVKNGRFGPYVVEQDSDAKAVKTASLFKSMSVQGVTLEQAEQLLSLPRVVGRDPSTAEEIVAHNGKYGPYIKMGSQTRSLEREEDLFSISLEGAVELLRAPKAGRRSAATSSTLQEFSTDDPVSGKPVVVKNGRFGPYVTDGVTNATIPKNMDADALSFEDAVVLLEQKRQKLAEKPAKQTKKRTGTTKATSKKATSTKGTTSKKSK